MTTVERKRYPRDIAKDVGVEIVSFLYGSAQRAQIAGSIRRLKPTVGDVEVLFVPKFERRQHPDDMFAAIDVNLADETIERMVRDGVLEKRLNIKGSETYGPKNKLMVHCASGIPVDLFSTSLENWWVSLVIRTGGKDTNLMLTTGAQKLGRKLHAYGRGVEILETGVLMPCNSERDVFEACVVPYREPEDRA